MNIHMQICSRTFVVGVHIHIGTCIYLWLCICTCAYMLVFICAYHIPCWWYWVYFISHFCVGICVDLCAIFESYDYVSYQRHISYYTISQWDAQNANDLYVCMCTSFIFLFYTHLWYYITLLLCTKLLSYFARNHKINIFNQYHRTAHVDWFVEWWIGRSLLTWLLIGWWMYTSLKFMCTLCHCGDINEMAINDTIAWFTCQCRLSKSTRWRPILYLTLILTILKFTSQWTLVLIKRHQ